MKEQLPLDDFEKRVRKTANNFSIIPSDGVFERISAEINEEPKKRRPLIYTSFISAIAAAIVLAAGLKIFVPEQQNNATAPQIAISKSDGTTLKSEENLPGNATVLSKEINTKHTDPENKLSPVGSPLAQSLHSGSTLKNNHRNSSVPKKSASEKQ